MFFLVSRTRYRIIVLSLVGIKSSLCLAEDYVFGSVGLTGFLYNNKHNQPVLGSWFYIWLTVWFYVVVSSIGMGAGAGAGARAASGAACSLGSSVPAVLSTSL